MMMLMMMLNAAPVAPPPIHIHLHLTKVLSLSDHCLSLLITKPPTPPFQIRWASIINFVLIRHDRMGSLAGRPFSQSHPPFPPHPVGQHQKEKTRKLYSTAKKSSSRAVLPIPSQPLPSFS